MISEVLTVGLLAGFEKNSRIQRVKRCGFELKSAHFANEGMVYHDEWVDGGGQELIRAGDEEFTRVYAGGVVKDEILRKLGVQKDEVIGQLIGMLTKLGEKTRLYDDCKYDEDDWSYRYNIIDEDNDTMVTTGKETIRYKDQTVFVHVLVMSPVR